MKSKPMTSRNLAALLCASLTLLLAAHAPACTWFEFRNDKNNPFIGRTMEWPGDLGAEITIIPRNYDFGSFKTDYGFVGMSHGQDRFTDGMNEHGLAVSSLQLDASQYAKKEEATFSLVDLMRYLLGKTKTVDEAIAFLKENKFYTQAFAELSGSVAKTHYAITEATGRSVVVEFVKGEVNVYENKVGAMTNDPTFDEQLKNWSKYDVKKFNEEDFQAFDYSPEGRFCRMAACNATQVKVPTDQEAVNRAWSMLNTVDIPKGILYWRFINDSPQFTSYAVVDDLTNRVYYFRSYDNYDIRKVDLSKIDFATVKRKSASLFGTANYQEAQFN
jgi:choloylglycine hydrolase